MTTSNEDDVTPTWKEVLETLRVDRARTGLQQTKIRSVTGLIALGMIFFGGWILLGNKIVISDEVKVMTASMVGFGLVSSPYAIALVKKLWSPPQCFVIRVNITKRDFIRIYTGSPDLWNDVTIVSGEPASYAVGNKMVYVVTDFAHTDDIDADSEFAQHVPDTADGRVAAGSWLGEASDAEIVHERQKVEKNRRRNDVRARIGDKLLATFESVGRNAELRHHNSMTEHSIRENLFDGDGVLDEVKNEVPELRELDEGKSVTEIIEDEVEQQIRALNTADNGSGGESDE